MDVKHFHIGSKAVNLLKLAESGFRVPPFVVLASDLSDQKTLLELLPEEVKKSEFFAVRSSAGAEDSKEKSYAGYFYSAVGVNLSEVFHAYRKVVASYNNMPGGVIIQQFVPSEKAGILFTRNGNDQVIIDANFGLCKSVVEGQPCDEYIFSGEGKKITSFIEISKKPLTFDGFNIKEEKNTIDKKVLSDKEIVKLIKAGRDIEKIFNSPQDIEWCFYRSELYILQSRPITKKNIPHEAKICYDSANIAESYSGIVLPLTLSFASKIYKTVYMNLLKASLVSTRKLRKHEAIFNEMIKSFYGRLYYNMNNWYLMMSFIPGYNRNKQNLENMITSNIREDIKRDVLPGPIFKITYPFIVVAKLIVLPLVQGRFKKKVRKYLKKYTLHNPATMSLQECVDVYKKLSKELLERWHIPVENDFMVMTYWGILKKRIPEDELKGMIRFRNKSASQIEAISDLSHRIHQNPDLAYAIEKSDVAGFENEIQKHSSILQEYNQYFSEYGGRFANELKLESPDLEEDKSKQLQLFQLYKEYKHTSTSSKTEQPNSALLRYSLRKFKKYAAKREEMRLYRSNCFSLVRKLFKQVGYLLCEQKLIKQIDDIFYLEVEDVLFACNKDKNTRFGEKILLNKTNYLGYSATEPLPYFRISESETPPLSIPGEPDTGVIYGRSCTPGVIRGRVRVFKEYFLPGTIDFDILIAKHTDPGWTSLIGLSKGMIIEHGGVLSHAAIVSREMEIPTVIGVENATLTFKTGQIVELNGSTGLVRIVNE